MSTPPARTVDRIRQDLVVPYRHAVGHALERFLAGLQDRRLLGLHCPSCGAVLCPPSAVCARCLTRTDFWVELPSTGVVKAFAVVHMTFPGQPVAPPFVYAEIVIDGAATTLVHQIGGVDFAAPDAGVSVGMRVEAVWAEQRSGSLLDIAHFRLLT